MKYGALLVTECPVCHYKVPSKHSNDRLWVAEDAELFEEVEFLQCPPEGELIHQLRKNKVTLYICPECKSVRGA